MRLTMKARQEVTKATAGQYRGASKKEKGKILDQLPNRQSAASAYLAQSNNFSIERRRRFNNFASTVAIVSDGISTSQRNTFLFR